MRDWQPRTQRAVALTVGLSLWVGVWSVGGPARGFAQAPRASERAAGTHAATVRARVAPARTDAAEARTKAAPAGKSRPPADGREKQAAARAKQPTAEPKNVALGKPYTLRPSPNYRLCTDPGDRRQLTDGQTTTAYFWTQKGTVGWQRAQYVVITVDLGKVEPICGVSMTTAAGRAGVTWPLAVHVLVSDDGKTYYDVGDLVELDHRRHGPWPKGYAIRKLETRELKTRGRFVQFLVVPVAGGPYFFTDEVEVFRGPDEWLRQPLKRGRPVTAAKLFQRVRLAHAVRSRWEADYQSLRELLDSVQLPADQRKTLPARMARLKQLGPDTVLSDQSSFRAVLPLGPNHAELFRVQAELWRAAGWPALTAWVPPTWDPVPLFGLPKKPVGEVQVDAMKGEFRAAAVNLANASSQTVRLRVRVDGLPGSPAPDYLTLHQVEWTDTSRLQPVAAALPLAPRDADGWRVTVRPGLVRQLWLTFHPVRLKPGVYSGRLVLQPEGGQGPKAGKPLTVPLRLHVWPLEFPTATTLWLGGWSYTDSDRYGVTKANRKAFLQHLQAHFVNAPWATSAVLRSFRFDKKNPDRIELDTSRLDRWLADWPNARAYLVFLSVAHWSGAIRTSLGGVELGSKDFDRRVATWIRACVRHLKSKGIAANQLAVLIHDEPHEGSDISALLAWARAIQKAEPDVLVWEDPTYRQPWKAPAELFQVCDVLCPNRPMWLQQGPRFARFYLDQRRKGKTLHFYSCSGPAKLLDPYSYYRLQAWHTWAVGGTGMFFWAFGDNGGASSWNEYSAKHGPYTPLFLDDQSVTPGKHMEAIREGVEDYEYFVLLRQAVERAHAAGRKDAVVRQAERLLQQAARQVLTAEGADRLRWHEPKDRTVADRVRVELLRTLCKLRGLEPPQP